MKLKLNKRRLAEVITDVTIITVMIGAALTFIAGLIYFTELSFSIGFGETIFNFSTDVMFESILELVMGLWIATIFEFCWRDVVMHLIKKEGIES